MRKFVILGSLLALVNLAATDAVAAERYSVNLTRKDRNLYKVDGERIWVQTRYCYTYAYGEEAALSAYEVVFLDSADKCDVKRVLKETQQSGNFNVQLTHEDDDLYSTLEGVFIKTSMCLNLGISEDAVLRLNGYGGGTVVFLDSDQRCQVDAVLTSLRL